jgi:5-methylcytosine-specific restriction endonuclease McrA
MTRGHRGSLLLRCRAPSSLASCRFIRALWKHVFVPELPEHRPHVSRAGRPPDPRRLKPVELRDCRRRGEAEFARYGRQWRCKKCVAEAVTRRHQLIRRTLIEWAGGACALCGYDRCVVSLHFHHVDPATKSIEMTMASGKSLATRRAEAQKCVLLCANCHGEVEAGLVESPPPGTKYPGPTMPPPPPRSPPASSGRSGR